MNSANHIQPRKQAGGRGGSLPGMGTAYALGTFNDNFFKQSVIFLAAGAGFESIQGLAATFFALPFIVFSAWAGWLADRFAKSRMVIWSKWLELAAMLAGLYMLLTLNWTGAVAVVFIMGLQSTLFSPALNGAIPENFAPAEVPRVNGLLKLATTATILLGVCLSGVVLDFPAFPVLSAFTPSGEYGFGRLAAGCLAVFVSLAGVAAALCINKSRSPSGHAAPFPWRGPFDSLLHALECRKKDQQLFLCLVYEAFFYGIASFVLLCITNLGVKQLHFSYTVTSMLSVALMAGICIGSVAAGRQEAAVWRRFALTAGLGIGTGLVLSSLAPLLPDLLIFAYLLATFLLVGICGGFYLIPVVSFIQLRAGATEKGKILGISNFASFSAVLLFGLLFAALGGVTPSLLLTGSGICTLLFLHWAKCFLRGIFPHTGQVSPAGLIMRLLLSLRYKVTLQGADVLTLPGPVLFLPNHPALIDPFIVYSLIAEYAPRPLADERRMGGFPGRLAGRLLRAILIPDLLKDGMSGRKGVEAGLKAVAAALKGGDSVLFYPSGRITHSGKEVIGGNSGLTTILRAVPGQRVVLVRTSGLWGSSFSFAATGQSPNFLPVLLRGALALLCNLIVFAPRRAVRVEFAEATNLPRLLREDDKTILNLYLESFYSAAKQPAMLVPRFFWQGRTPRLLPERDLAHTEEVQGISPETRTAVYALLRKKAALDAEQPLDDSMALNGDLGLDSLSLVDLALALEDLSGLSLSNLENLVTVGDCLRAVSNQANRPEADDAAPAPKLWFTTSSKAALVLPAGCANIAEAFCRLARSSPHAPLLADRSGVRARRQVLLQALILAGRFRKLPGQRLGLMLPASPAAVITWLAALLAGKVPVFFNWTVGDKNLRHCAAVTEIKHIVSATQLLERLARQGGEPDALPVDWIRLDKLAASLSPGEKIRGAFKARCMRSLTGIEMPETAAVLFTSGSEALPKAVPLTHANLLANAADVMQVLNLTMESSILAMLPPFHSFGLMVGLVLPLAFGARAAYHPNPTEADRLALLTRDFKLTMLAAPPTFLAGLLERTQGANMLESLRLAFVGAEKCPDWMYEAFAARCPDAALCEGYGITECSPVVAVNRPGDVLPGSIGRVMPSVTAALVREENGVIQGRAATGETGMLLVRGPSIFSGYLGDAPSPFVRFEGEEWYRTGDLASMDAGGRLFFTGRLKRFIKIGGEMISLPQIESALLEAFAARPDAPGGAPLLAVESTPEESGPEITVFTSVNLSLAEINAALKKTGFSPLHAAKRVIRLDAVPQLGNGKTDYQTLKKKLSTQ
ncbi:MAG: MFS transporter [Deltaproteobacteria bacterium]|jgi:acyl-CoA synthetase (AMP-forming)/AMP-acid ligase II/1-acyl-sn-glycerol-3-phosphate acyltransferase/acyl carrier protein|nr:MFS transporter [Deltaproteobacteria bacterium]